MSSKAVQEQKVIDIVTSTLIESENSLFGTDSDGNEYDTLEEMWISQGIIRQSGTDDDPVEVEEEEGEGASAWYEKGVDFWEDEDTGGSTVDGMLGGYGSISPVDVEGSTLFLKNLSSIRPELRLEGGTCCDCGAGIGRVAKNLLLPLGFELCHIVEVSPRLISFAPDFIGDPDASKCRFFCRGLQDFYPKKGTYDVIWIQWVIPYVTDADLVAFLRRCGEGLRPGGIVCIKDNMCEDKAFELDRIDSSIVRSLPYFLSLVNQAGLKIVMQRLQEDFPEGLFPVPMIALEVDTDCE